MIRLGWKKITRMPQAKKTNTVIFDEEGPPLEFPSADPGKALKGTETCGLIKHPLLHG